MSIEILTQPAKSLSMLTFNVYHFGLTFRSMKLTVLAALGVVSSDGLSSKQASFLYSETFPVTQGLEAEAETEPRATSLISQDASYLTLPSDLLFNACTRRKSILKPNLNNNQKQQCHATSSYFLPTRHVPVSPPPSHSAFPIP